MIIAVSVTFISVESKTRDPNPLGKDVGLSFVPSNVVNRSVNRVGKSCMSVHL